MNLSASTATADPHGPSGPRSFAVLAVLAVCTALVFVGLVALGTWQVQRRAWKLDLIAQVAQRVHATAVATPAPAQWPQVNAATDAYRHVYLTGTYLHAQTTLVQATTERGSGFWVVTPLQQADGSLVLVNRGFLPPEARAQAQAGPASATVTGLLRMTEPGAAFPRRNDPAADRWYSRDIQAIAKARGLHQVAPYFVDADAAADGAAEAWPLGGLTVVQFQNNHLVYAITWYTLALMVAAAAGYLVRDELRLRRLGRLTGTLETPPHDATPH
ncbi:surfeit locus 1 family protein [Rhodoferax ferrireducens]|uniref:SURF1-like protein n=1 Tax=Rhodoferax ferrireducens TaxID=192843 RepID=A0ABU2C7Y1_9BURK|nr:surfeit locus 1 family protein [Rhodoferax ferrireducens]